MAGRILHKISDRFRQVVLIDPDSDVGWNANGPTETRACRRPDHDSDHPFDHLGETGRSILPARANAGARKLAIDMPAHGSCDLLDLGSDLHFSLQAKTF